MMSGTNLSKQFQSDYYRVGDNLHGAFSQPYTTLEAARKQREVFISEALERLHGSSLTPEEAQALVEDWYWVCDDSEQRID